MDKTIETPDVLFLLGGIHDKFLMQDTGQIIELRELLNEKKFRVADTDLSYRQVNSLDTSGVLKDNRKDDKMWRVFSLKELIYLSVIKELKKYGVEVGQLLKLKKAFFSKEYALDTDESILVALFGEKIVLVLDSEAKLAFYTIPSYNLFERTSKSHININFNEIVLEVWENIGKKRIEYRDDLTLWSDTLANFDTDEKEAKLISLIRKEEYKTIIIKKNDKKEFVVKGEKAEVISEKELMKMIKEKDFADISIVKRDGNIVNIKVEDSFKI